MVFKANQEVILHDPVSEKPVNFGVIKVAHAESGFYEVDIQRLNNHFTMNWHEDLIKSSTPDLFVKQENNINKAELISAHLVDQVKTKFIPAKHTLDIPASFAQHSYLLRYIEMNIDGQKAWRLLTFQEYSLQVNPEDLPDEANE